METATYETDAVPTAVSHHQAIAAPHRTPEREEPVEAPTRTYADIAAALSHVKRDLVELIENGFPAMQEQPGVRPEDQVHQELEHFIRINEDAKSIHTLLMRMCADRHRS